MREILCAGIAEPPEIDSIRTLHEALKSEYGPDDERGASSQLAAADGVSPPLNRRVRRQISPVTF